MYVRARISRHIKYFTYVTVSLRLSRAFFNNYTSAKEGLERFYLSLETFIFFCSLEVLAKRQIKLSTEKI